MNEERTPGQRTIGELRAVADGLRLAVAGIDAFRGTWGAPEREPYLLDSPADVDSRTVGDHVLEALSLVDVRIAAAIDQADALATLGASAAGGKPTPAYAAMSIGRSAIEMLATAYWLLAPDVDARIRAGRQLALNHYEVSSQQALGATDSDEHLREIREEAQQLGLEEFPARNGTGFGEPFPGLTARVRAILDGDPTAYSLMSAASHGETWALIRIGFSSEPADQATWGVVLRKAPPAAGLWYPVTRSLAVLMACAWREATYRGWDLADLARVGEEAYTAADFPASMRFWHI